VQSFFSIQYININFCKFPALQNGNTPLFVALHAGSRGACQELLTADAHEQMRVFAGPHKDTPLHMAVRQRDLDIARIFVDAGANVDAKNVNSLASKLSDSK